MIFVPLGLGSSKDCSITLKMCVHWFDKFGYVDNIRQLNQLIPALWRQYQRAKSSMLYWMANLCGKYVFLQVNYTQLLWISIKAFPSKVSELTHYYNRSHFQCKLINKAVNSSLRVNILRSNQNCLIHVEPRRAGISMHAKHFRRLICFYTVNKVNLTGQCTECIYMSIKVRILYQDHSSEQCCWFVSGEPVALSFLNCPHS